MKKVFLYFVSFALVQLVCGGVMSMAWLLITGNSDTTAMSIISMTVVASVVAIILFLAMKWYPLSRKYMQTRPWMTIMWCMFLALGMLIPLGLLEELIPEDLRTDIMGDTFKMVMSNEWGYLTVGILAPLVEEMVFRGAILREALKFFEEKFAVRNCNSINGSTLRNNLPHWVAIVFTALLFAAIHGNPAQMPHAMLVGMLLGWLAYRSGSIVPGIVVHWVNNTAAYVLVALHPEAYDMSITEMFGHDTTRIALAIFFSMMIFFPSLLQLHYILTKEKRESWSK